MIIIIIIIMIIIIIIIIIKRKLGSETTTLVIPNEEMNDLVEVVLALEDTNLLLKGVTEKGKNEIK